VNALAEHYEHRAAVTYDGSETVCFRWHWPRGTFDRRMSALEIAQFIMPHMPSILPLLSDHPQVHREFETLMYRLILWPQQVLDEVKPWIRRVEHQEEEDEILVLDLGAKEPPKDLRLHFDMGGR